MALAKQAAAKQVAPAPAPAPAGGAIKEMATARPAKVQPDKILQQAAASDGKWQAAVTQIEQTWNKMLNDTIKLDGKEAKVGEWLAAKKVGAVTIPELKVVFRKEKEFLGGKSGEVVAREALKRALLEIAGIEKNQKEDKNAPWYIEFNGKVQVEERKTELTLVANKKQCLLDQAMNVDLKFSNYEKVRLRFEPEGIFTVAKKEVTQPGPIQLKAVKPGKTKLTAEGLFAGQVDKQQVVELTVDQLILTLKGGGFDA